MPLMHCLAVLKAQWKANKFCSGYTEVVEKLKGIFMAAGWLYFRGAYPIIEKLLEEGWGFSKGQTGVVWSPEDLKVLRENRKILF